MINCFDMHACVSQQIWYALSKTMAERAAWEYCKDNEIQLITVLPTFVIGPSLPSDLCSTASDVLGLLKGLAFFNFHRNIIILYIKKIYIFCYFLI